MYIQNIILGMFFVFILSGCTTHKYNFIVPDITPANGKNAVLMEVKVTYNPKNKEIKHEELKLEETSPENSQYEKNAFASAWIYALVDAIERSSYDKPDQTIKQKLNLFVDIKKIKQPLFAAFLQLK